MSSIDWSTLTRVPNKARLYRQDVYFRECFDDAQNAFGPEIHEVLWQSALLIVTPDGLATAQLGTICDYLTDHGFSFVAVQPFFFDRLSWRELWRYQINRATLDHLALSDLVLRAGPALMLLLRNEGSHDVPATVRLTSLKGKSDPVDQKPGTLRSSLRYSTRSCGMVHCADEPADLIRELGLLTDAPARRRLLGRLAAGLLDAHDRELLDQQLELFSRGGIALDGARAQQRVTDAVRQAVSTGASPALVDAALGYLDRMIAGHSVPWRGFIATLDRLDLDLDPWDLVLVGTGLVVSNEPGVSSLIESPDLEKWAAQPVGLSLSELR